MPCVLVYDLTSSKPNKVEGTCSPKKYIENIIFNLFSLTFSTLEENQDEVVEIEEVIHIIMGGA